MSNCLWHTYLFLLQLFIISLFFFCKRSLDFLGVFPFGASHYSWHVYYAIQDKNYTTVHAFASARSGALTELKNGGFTMNRDPCNSEIDCPIQEGDVVTYTGHLGVLDIVSVCHLNSYLLLFSLVNSYFFLLTFLLL